MRFLGRALQRHRRRLRALDGLGDGVEVAGADLALVLDRGDALVGRCELGLLQLDERAHLPARVAVGEVRSEEHSSELQSIMRTSSAVFCLKKKIKPIHPLLSKYIQQT